MQVTVSWRSGSKKEPVSFDLSSDATLDDLKKAFSAKFPKYYPSRQRFTLPAPAGAKKRVPLSDGPISAQAGGSARALVEFKDLGPQIAWRTVFLAEYAGPLVLYALSALQPAFLYGSAARTGSYANEAFAPSLVPGAVSSALSLGCVAEHAPWLSAVQRLALALHSLHYAKRLLETLFVHRFSNGTMPLSNLFKNCWYYWFFGFTLGYFVNHPMYTAPPAIWSAAGFAAFLVAEAGNLHCHITLRNLRPPGTRIRRIPRGIWFSLVSCPNYTFEILAWASFAAATRTAAGVAFLFVGAAQMTVWALKKHRNYRKEFKDYPRVRKSIFPFLI